MATINLSKNNYLQTQGMILKPTLQQYKKKETIDGLQIIKYPIFPSEGGDFAEYVRINEDGVTLGKGDGMFDIKGFTPRQMSRSFMPGGVTKAWHLHTKQNEIWLPTVGRFILGFYDNREESLTKGNKLKIYAGTDNQIAIVIPSGVAHGYKNIGSSDSLLVYITDQQWDGTDEYRLPWDSKDINFDWEIPNE